MSTKSKLFKGVEAADIEVSFRSNVRTLVSLSPEKIEILLRTLLDEAQRGEIANLTNLTRKVIPQMGMPYEETRALVLVGRLLAMRLAEHGDRAEDVADDLLIPA